jgi:hypothetical protein
MKRVEGVGGVREEVDIFTFFPKEIVDGKGEEEGRWGKHGKGDGMGREVCKEGMLKVKVDV